MRYRGQGAAWREKRGCVGKEERRGILYRFYPCFKLLPAHCGRRAWVKGRCIGQRKGLRG